MRNWSDWESSSRSGKGRKPELARNLSHTSRHPPACLFGDQPGEIIHAAHDITPMCSQPEASQHPAEQKDFKSDLLWWKLFSAHWNGASLICD